MVTLKRMILLLTCFNVVAGLAMEDCYGMVGERMQDANAEQKPVEQSVEAPVATPVVEQAPVVAPVVEQPVVVEQTPVVAPVVVETAPVAASVEQAVVAETPVEQAPAVVEQSIEAPVQVVEQAPVAAPVEQPVAAQITEQAPVAVETAPVAQEPTVEVVVTNPVVGAPVVEVIKEEVKPVEVKTVVEQAPVASEAKPAEAKPVVVEQAPVAVETPAVPVGILGALRARVNGIVARSCAGLDRVQERVAHAVSGTYEFVAQKAASVGNGISSVYTRASDGAQNAWTDVRARCSSMRDQCADVYAQHPMAVKAGVATVGFAVVVAAGYGAYRWAKRCARPHVLVVVDPITIPTQHEFAAPADQRGYRAPDFSVDQMGE